MAGLGDYKKGKKFTLKSGNKPSSFKMMGSSSPLHDEKSDKLKKQRGVIDTSKDEEIMLKAGDRTKKGGEGATSYEEAEAVNLAKTRARNKRISKMSKKEMMQDLRNIRKDAKKPTLINRLLTSKRKLRSQMYGESGKDYYAAKGTGFGRQAMSKKHLKDLGGDEYTGVAE